MGHEIDESAHCNRAPLQKIGNPENRDSEKGPMALPLTKLLKKKTKFLDAWDASASQSVRELKMAITRYPVLRAYGSSTR
jgi:hypothetical protein